MLRVLWARSKFTIVCVLWRSWCDACQILCAMYELPKYKVVQIWPGQTVTCLHTNSPGHIWTTLYYVLPRDLSCAKGNLSTSAHVSEVSMCWITTGNKNREKIHTQINYAIGWRTLRNQKLRYLDFPPAAITERKVSQPEKPNSTHVGHWALTYGKLIQCTPSRIIYERSILLLSSHLHRGPPSGRFPSRVPNNIYVPRKPHARHHPLAKE